MVVDLEAPVRREAEFDQSSLATTPATSTAYAWAEQYLVHAFLAFNENFEVVLPAHALATEFPDVVAKTIPSFHADVRPGLFGCGESANTSFSSSFTSTVAENF